MRLGLACCHVLDVNSDCVGRSAATTHQCELDDVSYLHYTSALTDIRRWPYGRHC